MRTGHSFSISHTGSFVLLLGALSACAGEAAPPEDAAMDSAPAVTATLYERLGGQQAIVAVVDSFVATVAADARINAFFANTDIPRLKTLLVEQLCAGTGGGCTYTGRDMKATHTGMGVKAADFAALVDDLVKTLNAFNVPQQEQDELLAILGPMQTDIVTP